MSTTFNPGQQVRIGLRFTVDSVATDPDDVYAYVKDGAGTTTTYEYGVDSELTRTGAGNYKLLYTIEFDDDIVGTYHVTGRGTGACVAVEQGSFYVRQLNVTV